MLFHAPHRVRVYHTGTAGTSPEAWNREIQAELRARISTLGSDAALSENAMGRWEGIATHRIRVEYHAAIVPNCILYDVVRKRAYLVLGEPRHANKTDAAGLPDHLICTAQAWEPAPTLE